MAARQQAFFLLALFSLAGSHLAAFFLLSFFCPRRRALLLIRDFASGISLRQRKLFMSAGR